MFAWLYILRLKSGNLYIGATMDLDGRCRLHFEGKACRTTKNDPPIALVHSEEFSNNLEARRREAQIKRWSRAKKEALVSGDMSRLKELSKSREKIRNPLSCSNLTLLHYAQDKFPSRSKS